MIVTPVPQIPGRYAFKNFTVAEQAQFRAYVTSRYLESFWSIRELAVATGGSYGFIHKILTDAGVELRPRGTPRARIGWMERDAPAGDGTEAAPRKQTPPPPFLIPGSRSDPAGS